MQYVYVLQGNKDKEIYVGCTKDLKNRLVLHNAKKVVSTKRHAPYSLIYYEVYIDERDAFAREQYIKTGWGKKYLRKALNNFFINKNLVG